MQRIFAVIARRFEKVTVLVEIMNPAVAKRFREKSIEGSHAKFSWGVKGWKEFSELVPTFRLVGEHSLTEGMAAFAPIYKVLGRIPLVNNISNKIIVMEK